MIFKFLFEQDIIENDDITLDWMFKMSLLRDLVNVGVILNNTIRLFLYR